MAAPPPGLFWGVTRSALRHPSSSRRIFTSASQGKPSSSTIADARVEHPHHHHPIPPPPSCSQSPRARPKQRLATEAGAGERRPGGSNPSLSFPCLDANERRAERLRRERGVLAGPSSEPGPLHRAAPSSETNTTVAAPDDETGPEPAYSKVVSGYETFHHPHPFPLDYGGTLPSFDIAYETWGQLNADRSNAILLHTGLSASSHARSSEANPAQGWWEKFIGPGKAIDTNRWFVICTNVLGGCYGSTGPSSIDPSDGQPYATRFPIISVFDMVRAQFILLDHLGIDKLYASVGSSMGGMQSVAAAHLEPDRVSRVVSISGSARSSPASIALRFAQRSVLMADPNWNRGNYYAPGSLPPHTGMKLARQIATITYRSGPEWEQRFGRRRRGRAGKEREPIALGSQTGAEANMEEDPALCPDFLIETYLDHQGETFCLKYDANSLIYISKAMDLFDMSDDSLQDLQRRWDGRAAFEKADQAGLHSPRLEPSPPAVALSAYPSQATSPPPLSRPHISTLTHPAASTYIPSLARGLRNLSNIPTLVIGAQSDILFPVEQQRELAECLRMNGNNRVSYYEVDSPYGHDTFLIDTANVGGALKGFLS